MCHRSAEFHERQAWLESKSRRGLSPAICTEHWTVERCEKLWTDLESLYYNTLYNVKTLEYLSVLTLQRHFSSFPSTATLAVRLSQFWSSGSNGTSWCPACRLSTPLAQPGSHDQTTSAIRPQRCCLRLTPLPPTLVAGLDPLVHESWYYACSPTHLLSMYVSYWQL